MTSPPAAGPASGPTARPHRLLPAIAVAAACALAAACSGGGTGAPADREAPVDGPPAPRLAARSDPLPTVTPTPHDMRWLGPDVAVPPAPTVVPAAEADAAAVGAVVEALEAAGATDVRVAGTGQPEGGERGASGEGGGEGGDPALTVHVGPAGDPDLRARLEPVGVSVPADLPAEGYALAAVNLTDGSAEVVLAGADGPGTFYAAQTLRQLAAGGSVAGVAVVDRPAMRHRGSVEGFYGSPWTTEERLDQLAFHGRFKLNTYIYAPKDDPFHRERWREPYPPDRLADLRTLVEAATRHHVRLTFAVSPGVSICYSDPADTAALVAKLEAVHALGVRDFSIALDDIDHTRWSCAGDAARYGPPSTEAAARAQVELLNAVQRGFVAEHPGTRPLQTVPTEYQGTRDSAYRRVLRDHLDPAVEVMWTGAYVVPDEITVEDARAAADRYGRPVYVWDNTPVNDFPATEGRLILAPYARREPGLSAHVTGIVLNPMNQAAASKVQLVGAADFAWNDGAYDAARAHRAAAHHLAGRDAATTEALLAFFDLEHLAPTSALSGVLSQPQAPALAARLDEFRRAWSSGDPRGALAGLRPYAERLAAAPGRIRAGVTDPAFVADCAPWLDAAALWGEALVTTLDGLAAGLDGDGARAAAARATARDLAQRASAIRTIPGETRPEGPVRVGDGVLDSFIAEAATLG